MAHDTVTGGQQSDEGCLSLEWTLPNTPGKPWAPTVDLTLDIQTGS